jgi:hypothetical protein
MDRRMFLSAAAVAAAVPLLGTRASAQNPPAPAPTTPKPNRTRRLAEAMAANRMALDFDGSRFSGTGYDWLLKRGQEANAFLLGEEHGIAENPKLAAQLFTALVPAGYRHAVVEISPPMADFLDGVARRGGPTALRKALNDPDTRVAFFGLKEEADWLAQARAAVPGTAEVIWGIDYEVVADRHLIGELKSRQMPAGARAALARLEAASAASWAKYAATHNPQFIFSFAGAPKLVADLRSAWPGVDARSRVVMDTLEQTLAINALFVSGKGYDSNLLRSKLMRRNFLRYWRGKPDQDRVFMKMGASHLTRGPSFLTDIFDVGSMVPELVAERGGESFSVMVLPGPGTQTASMDPSVFRYVPGNRDQYGEGMDLFDAGIIPGKFTVFDTAPLRPIAGSYSGEVPLPLWRVIHGFDAVLIMAGSHPSSNL